MPRYPESRRSDVEDVLHGTAVPDPYRWLEDLDAPETAAWVAQQNALTECWLADVQERAELRRRVAELWDHPRSSPPWRRGERWFQLRNTGLQDQDVLWVVDDPDDADALVQWAKFSGAAWAPDGSGFWYGRYDAAHEGEAFEEANRGHRLHFHRLGQDQGDDVAVSYT